MPDRPARPRMRHAVAIAVGAILAVACADATPQPRARAASESQPTRGPATTSTVEESNATERASDSPTLPLLPTEVHPCLLLEDAELEALAGAELASSSERTVEEVPQCRWTATDDTVVQVMAASSAAWGVSLEPVLERAADLPNLSPEDAEELERAREELSEHGALEAQQACDFFSLMARIGGASGDTSQIVNYVPMGDGSTAVSGQKCTDERFTSVVLAKPGLQPGPEVEQQMREALNAAHERAVSGRR